MRNIPSNPIAQFVTSPVGIALAAYLQSLEAQASGRLKPIPLPLRDIASRYYPEINLEDIYYAENINGFAMKALTVDRHIYFKQYVDVEGAELGLLLHELQHCVQYNSLGLSGFLARYISEIPLSAVTSLARAITGGDLDMESIHDQMGTEREAIDKAARIYDEVRDQVRVLFQGDYRIGQLSSRRFLDAYQSSHDFRVTLRDEQNNDTQKWNLTPVGSLCTLQQLSSNRFLDAYDSGHDYEAITRTDQNNDSQRWVIISSTGDSHTVRQLNTGRFLDAYGSAANDFTATTRPAQHNDTQRWIKAPSGTSLFTFQQRSGSRRFLDAYQSSHDHRVTTREEQDDDTQKWYLKPVGSVCTIQQVSTGRYLDAYGSLADDFGVVTRERQNNDSQRWVIMPETTGDSYSVRQLSTLQFLDAYSSTAQDYAATTRPRQHNDTQRWLISR